MHADDPTRDTLGDPQTHLDNDPVNLPDAADDVPGDDTAADDAAVDAAVDGSHEDGTTSPDEA